jgi:5'-nucleotidase
MAKVKVKATKKKEEPIILVTNDDGYTAPGIHALVEAVKGWERL